MAGWTYIPLADLDRWQRTTVWVELYTAWNERRVAIGQSAVTVPAAGFKIQDKDAIQDIQEWIETYASSFVATIDGSLNPVTDYDGADAIEMWDWTKLKTRVLSGNSSWSRKSGSTLSYGQLAKGYNASFITQINELRLIFNQLVWTKKGISFNNQAENNESFGEDSGNSSWLDAKANAISQYNSDISSWNGAPQRGTATTVNSGLYQYLLLNVYSYMKTTGLSNLFAKTVDFYLLSGTYWREVWGDDETMFDNDSASYLQYLKYGKYPTSSTLLKTDTETDFYLIGDITKSVPPDFGIPTTGAYYLRRGWSIISIASIIRWNVTDGFEYV